MGCPGGADSRVLSRKTAWRPVPRSWRRPPQPPAGPERLAVARHCRHTCDGQAHICTLGGCTCIILCIRAHVRIWIRMAMRMCMHVCMYVHVCADVDVYVYRWVCILHVHMYVHVYADVYAYASVLQTCALQCHIDVNCCSPSLCACMRGRAPARHEHCRGPLPWLWRRSPQAPADPFATCGWPDGLSGGPCRHTPHCRFIPAALTEIV